MTNWFVSYKVQMFNDMLVISGPYETVDEAHSHALDIGGYEGVTNCLVYSECADELLDGALTQG
jgi:hypothetical protein